MNCFSAMATVDVYERRLFPSSEDMQSLNGALSGLCRHFQIQHVIDSLLIGSGRELISLLVSFMAFAGDYDIIAGLAKFHCQFYGHGPVCYNQPFFISVSVV